MSKQLDAIVVSVEYRHAPEPKMVAAKIVPVVEDHIAMPMKK